MTALLAAEHVAVGLHLLEHVAIADAGLDDGDLCLAHRDLESEIGHHRCHDRVVRELARVTHALGEDREDVIAVDHVAEAIDREAAIGIAVVRDARIGAVLLDRRDEILEMRASAVLVDVVAIGRVMDRDHRGAGARVELGGNEG